FAGDGLEPPASDDDLPRFMELDPMEEGDRALVSTSLVARRLAARAGLVDDPGPPVVPATGQHPVLYTRSSPSPAGRKPAAARPSDDDDAARAGPARSRRRLAIASAIALLLLALAAVVLWTVL